MTAKPAILLTFVVALSGAFCCGAGGTVASKVTYDTKLMLEVANTLASEPMFRPSEDDRITHCNEFVRTWFERVTGHSIGDLDGLANEQFAHLASDRTNWRDITDASDWKATYNTVIDAAVGGHIVLATWKNPRGHGHIAVVLPLRFPPLFAMGYVGHWDINSGMGLQVPIIAEASTKNRRCTRTGVDARTKLSCGFGADKQPDIHFFEYMPTKH